jgi:hypothetical protein
MHDPCQGLYRIGLIKTKKMKKVEDDCVVLYRVR